jgi:hypothetical protein
MEYIDDAKMALSSDAPEVRRRTERRLAYSAGTTFGSPPMDGAVAAAGARLSANRNAAMSA